jgi:hypothetical protein
MYSKVLPPYGNVILKTTPNKYQIAVLDIADDAADMSKDLSFRVPPNSTLNKNMNMRLAARNPIGFRAAIYKISRAMLPNRTK